MALSRVRAVWSGFPGANGVSTFHFSSAVPPLIDLRGFLQGVAAAMPSDVSIQIQGEGDIIEPLTGVVTGAWTSSAPTVIPGAAGGVYSAPSGAVVNWSTGGVLDGRRLKGKTYLVPLSAAAYDTAGSIDVTWLPILRAAATAFVAAVTPNFVIWHRPFAGSPAWTDVHGRAHPAKPARAGGYQPVSGSFVPDKCVILRSRRD